MKVSTKSKNAVAMLAFMGCFAQERVVPMERIEEKLKLSSSYCAQIMAELKNEGIVESKMGVGGGYFIPESADFDELTVGDVCRAVEKDMYVLECVFDTSKCDLKKDAYKCSVREMMCDISDVVFDALDSIYIKDISDMLEKNGLVNKADYLDREAIKDENVGKKQIWNAWLD